MKIEDQVDFIQDGDDDEEEVAPDFARGKREDEATAVTPTNDFARGIRKGEKPEQDPEKEPDFARGVREDAPDDVDPDFARGIRKEEEAEDDNDQ